jgi:hypothetical protein
LIAIIAFLLRVLSPWPLLSPVPDDVLEAGLEKLVISLKKSC